MGKRGRERNTVMLQSLVDLSSGEMQVIRGMNLRNVGASV